MEDWMKSCRYCRFYNLAEGYCTKDMLEIDLENNIDTIIEDGLIEAAIREGFLEKKFNSISKTKSKEFYEELEQMKNNWIEEISEQVSRLLRNNLQQVCKVIPQKENEFCCSCWD